MNNFDEGFLVQLVFLFLLLEICCEERGAKRGKLLLQQVKKTLLKEIGYHFVYEEAMILLTSFGLGIHNHKSNFQVLLAQSKMCILFWGRYV